MIVTMSPKSHSDDCLNSTSSPRTEFLAGAGSPPRTQPGVPAPDTPIVFRLLPPAPSSLAFGQRRPSSTSRSTTKRRSRGGDCGSGRPSLSVRTLRCPKPHSPLTNPEPSCSAVPEDHTLIPTVALCRSENLSDRRKVEREQIG